MPGAILPNTGIQLPELGGDSGTWDDQINDGFRNYDAHDHSPGKGARIPTAGININADLSFAGKAATNVARISFSEVAALSTGADALFVNNADHELYWRTAGGVNVKLTSGTALNSALLGGIAGDYVSIGALVAFDDLTDRYTFQQEIATAVRQWGRLAASDLDLYEFKAAGNASVPAHRVRLSSPAALAADYALTLPAALPGSTLLMQVSAAGVISASQTLASAPTAPDYKFSTGQTIVIPVSASDVGQSSAAKGYDAFGGFKQWNFASDANVNPITFPIVLPAGMQITGYGFTVWKTSGAAVHLKGKLVKITSAGVASNPDTGNAGGIDYNANNPGFTNAMQPTSAVNVPATDGSSSYTLLFWTDGTSADSLLSAFITVTRP